MLKKEKYKNFDIYFFELEYFELAKNIIDKKINDIKELKNTQRNYVVKIKYNKENYVLKEARNEYKKLQRRICTFFKKGEALTTLINLHNLIYKENMKEMGEPVLCIVSRNYGLINYSALVMNNIEGTMAERKNLEEVIKIIKKLHEKKRYHGDFNPSNFIVTSEKEIRIIDTQGKKMVLGNYRAHYDMLTMKIDSYDEMVYPYNKNIFYYMALLVKKLKKFFKDKG